MTKKSSSYRQALLDSLTNPIEAAEYLNAAIEDSTESFLKALGNVAQARQMTKVAKDAGVQRETLYRSFSSQGNPTLTTLHSVLHAVGLKIFFGAEKSEGLASLPIGVLEHSNNPKSARKIYPLEGGDVDNAYGGYASMVGQDMSWAFDGNLPNVGAEQYATCGGH